MPDLPLQKVPLLGGHFDDLGPSIITASRESAEDTFGPGTSQITYLDEGSGGTITMLERPDGKPASVLELLVPEAERQKGVGARLQAHALQMHPNMMGQVSSRYAAKSAYDLGRRPFDAPDATLEDVYKLIEENSSVNLISQAPSDAAKMLDAIDAWQGSPHRFDRFSSEHIGTGEGAQAFGHGLYFAEAKEVGEGYRKQLTSAGDSKVGDKPILSLYEDLSAKADRLPYERAAPEYEKMAFLEDLELTDSFEEALSRIDDTATEAWARSEIQPNFTPAGHLYNVDLNVTPDELLDWDASLSGQSEAVKAKLKPILDGIDIDDFDTGGALYNKLVVKTRAEQDKYFSQTQRQALGRSPLPSPEELVSKRLNEAGVSGIRYLDAGSRSAREGTRNYVIFDDALIDIKQRMNRGGIIERKEDNRTYI